jgi:hypothetical protein
VARAKPKPISEAVSEEAAMVQIKRPIVPAFWGKDHVSTLLYLESRAVDHGGEIDGRQMRTDANVHPHLAHDLGRYPTRLYGGLEAVDHDDWSCCEDLAAVGLLSSVGTGLHPRYVLTDLGWRVVSAVRRARAEGGRAFDPMRRAMLAILDVDP